MKPCARHAVAGRDTPAPSRGATTMEVRAPALFGLGLIDELSDEDIRRSCASKKANVRDDGRIGRFGRKAQNASLWDFVRVALHDEMGLTSPGAIGEGMQRDDDREPDPEVSAEMVDALAAFLRGLAPPPRLGLHPEGEAVFARIGCTDCHTPVLAGRVPGVYSDLCLHAMGPGFDIGIENHSARGDEWRTAPLWGCGCAACTCTTRGRNRSTKPSACTEARRPPPQGSTWRWPRRSGPRSLRS